MKKVFCLIGLVVCVVSLVSFSEAQQSGTIVDLTGAMSESLPGTWPSHMLFADEKWIEFTDATGKQVSPYQTHFVIMDEHYGTHFDAPAHFIPPKDSGLPFAGPMGEVTGDKVLPEDLIGPAVVIDVRSLCDPKGPPGVSPIITADYIKAWEAKNGPIQAKDIVLFYSGWDAYYKPGDEGRHYAKGPALFKDTPGHPAPEAETAIYLYDKGVKTIGTDGPSMGSLQNGAAVHQQGLGRGMLFIEGLVNLGQLPVRGAQLIFLPLKIEGSTGAPGRAIAILPAGK